MEKNNNDWRKKILEEMVVDYSDALEKNFNIAKRFIRITKQGKISILFKNSLSGKEQISLYLIGKRYAKEAGLTTTEGVGSKELMEELGAPKGSIYPWLKELRDKHRISQVEEQRHIYYSIPINLIEKTLKEIENKKHRG